MDVNVACIKWGTRYGAHYVNNLYRGVETHLSRPFRFLCYTDDATGLCDGIEVVDIDRLVVHPSLRNDVFQKLSLIHSGSGLSGPTLFLDLDVILLGSLDPLFDYEPGKFCIIWNWIAWRKTLLRKRPDVGNSSVFRFEAGQYDHVLEEYLADPNRARTEFPTEQAFLTECVRETKQYWPDDWVRSFKYQCRPVFPLNWIRPPKIDPRTRILVFHGRPDPEEIVTTGYDGTWHRKVLPQPALQQHWQVPSDARAA